MEAAQVQKNTLRQALRQKAAGLPMEYRAAADASITAALLALPEYERAQTIFCYVGVKAEPGTRDFIEAALKAGKTVAVPRCVGKRMEARQITGISQLHPAPFGLLEPDETAPLAAPESIGLVVAPCVACDKAGNRLGNGAGHYDRFLAGVNCPVLCLCYATLLQDTLPTEATDVPVQVLTEQGMFP